MTALGQRRPFARLSAFSIPSIEAPLRKAISAVSFYYPFTLAGTAVFAGGVYLFASGFMLENVYALLLGVLVPVLLGLLALLGRIQAIRCSRAPLRWDSSAALVAGRRCTAEKIETDRARTLPFYRLHVRSRGRLQVSGGASLGVSREVAAEGGRAEIELQLPLAGVYSSRGTTAIRDIFCLSRSRFGAEQLAFRPVLPRGSRGGEQITISATGGNEEQNRKSHQEDEKYFMREYIPGDRARDINWKASSRLAQLITRISPFTQEKSQVIFVDIRPFRAPGPESLDSVLHLDRMKSRLLGFIHTLRQEHPEYSFQVSCADARWLVHSDEELEGFARDLAGIFYRQDPGHVAPATAQLVVFTTPFDSKIQAALAGYGKAVLHVLTTTSPKADSKEAIEPAPLFEGAFSSARIDLPLPGRWAFRRERVRSRVGRSIATPAGGTGTVTEEPIAVTLFGEP